MRSRGGEGSCCGLRDHLQALFFYSNAPLRHHPLARRRFSELGALLKWRLAKFLDSWAPSSPCHCHNHATSLSFVCFWGTPLPPSTADVIYGSPLQGTDDRPTRRLSVLAPPSIVRGRIICNARPKKGRRVQTVPLRPLLRFAAAAALQSPFSEGHKLAGGGDATAVKSCAWTWRG